MFTPDLSGHKILVRLILEILCPIRQNLKSSHVKEINRIRLSKLFLLSRFQVTTQQVTEAIFI